MASTLTLMTSSTWTLLSQSRSSLQNHHLKDPALVEASQGKGLEAKKKSKAKSEINVSLVWLLEMKLLKR